MLATFASYYPVYAIHDKSQRAGYIWDDDVLLTDNMLMKQPDALKRFWYEGQRKPEPAQPKSWKERLQQWGRTHAPETPDYYPITWTTLWLEYQAWNGTENATPFHVTNIAFAALGAVMPSTDVTALKATTFS